MKLWLANCMILALMGFVFTGCDSRSVRSLSDRVAALEQREHDAEQCRSAEDNLDYRLRAFSSRMTDLDNRMKTVESRLSNATSLSTKFAESQDDQIAKLSEQVADLLARVDKLNAALEHEIKRNRSGGQTGVEVSKYNQLVQAHNNLYEFVKELNENFKSSIVKLKKIDECVNGVSGDISIWPSSWLLDLKSKVDSLDRKVRYGY